MGLFKNMFKKPEPQGLSIIPAKEKPADKPSKPLPEPAPVKAGAAAAAPPPPVEEQEEIVLAAESADQPLPLLPETAVGQVVAPVAPEAAEPLPAVVEPAPAPPPVEEPLVDERESLRRAWQEMMDLRQGVLDAHAQIQNLSGEIQEKDRSVFDGLRQTQEIIVNIFDLLAGKDQAKTLDEINDMLASEIGLDGESALAVTSDKDSLLGFLKEKALAVAVELEGYLHRTKNLLVQAQSIKQKREARLSVVAKQLEDAIRTQSMTEELRDRLISEKSSLENEIDSVNAGRQNLEAQISLLEERFKKVVEEKEAIESKARGVDTVKVDLVSKLAASRKELEETETTIENLRQSLQTVEEEKAKADQELKNVLREKERTHDDIQLVEKTISDRGRQKQRLEREIQATEERLIALRAEIDEVVHAREDLESQKSDREGSVEGESLRLAEMEKELDRLLEEKTSLTEQLQRERDLVLQTENTLKDQNARLAAKNEDIQFLVDETTKINEELAELKRQLEEATARKTEFSKQTQQLVSDESAAENLSGFEEEFTRVTNERDDVLASLQQAKADLETYEQELSAARGRRDEEARRSMDLEARLQEVMNEVADLRQQLKKQQKEAEAAKQETLKADEQADEAKLNIEQKMQQLTALLEDRSRLSEDMARMEREREKNREKEKERERDKVREKEREREQDREREKERERAKERERELELEQERAREREKEKELKVSGVALISKDTVYEVLEEGTIAAEPEKVEELSPSQKKAQRLARVIVSDIILYNKEILNTAANQRNFYEILEQPIRRSEEYFREKVPKELIEDRDYLKEELEKLRVSLKP